MTPEIKIATAEDIFSIYGKPLPYAGKAWCAWLDGKIVGIAGIYFQPKQAIMFSDMMIDGMSVPKKAVWRTVKCLWANIMALGIPAVAVCSGEFINSGPMLERLGFVYVGRDSSGIIYRSPTWP
jgi:hypothetical protein